MLAPLFEVKETKDKGKALFAKQFIPKGTIIWVDNKDYKVYTKEEIVN